MASIKKFASPNISPKILYSVLIPALAWGAFMMIASVIAFILLVHGILALGLGNEFSYDNFFEFVDKFLGSGVCLSLSSTAGIFSFLFIFDTRKGGTGRASFLVSAGMWAAIGVWFVVTQPESLNDNPPFLVVGFLAVIMGFGYPFILLYIMDMIGRWLGLEIISLPANGTPSYADKEGKI